MLFFHQQIGLKFKEGTGKCHIWSIAVYSVETWTVRKVDQKYTYLEILKHGVEGDKLDGSFDT